MDLLIYNSRKGIYKSIGRISAPLDSDTPPRPHSLSCCPLIEIELTLEQYHKIRFRRLLKKSAHKFTIVSSQSDESKTSQTISITALKEWITKYHGRLFLCLAVAEHKYI